MKNFKKEVEYIIGVDGDKKRTAMLISVADYIKQELEEIENSYNSEERKQELQKIISKYGESLEMSDFIFEGYLSYDGEQLEVVSREEYKEVEGKE